MSRKTLKEVISDSFHTLWDYTVAFGLILLILWILTTVFSINPKSIIITVIIALIAFAVFAYSIYLNLVTIEMSKDEAKKEVSKEKEAIEKEKEALTNTKERLYSLNKSVLQRENNLSAEFTRLISCQNDIARKKEELDEYQKEKISELSLIEQRIEHNKASLQDLLKEGVFSRFASLMADMESLVFDDSIHYLKTKRNPAPKSADEVKEMKTLYHKAIENERNLRYKWEFLLSSFPELSRYVDDDESLLSLGDFNSIDDLTEHRDRSRDYLSDEEWTKLSEDERNQLALDHYNEKAKSNWTIGIEYEMYIEFLLRSKGYTTIPFGSLKGLEDLGRDIIAYNVDQSGMKHVYIIQCKRWSTANGKQIHENVVCQTFGTAIEYSCRHKGENITVHPVVITSGEFSPMAKEFGEKLGVHLVQCPMGEYPRIKCNCNDGNKIYHLPFDQQYYTTKIDGPEEFYAWTVQEAVDKGFRRAMKHIGR